MAGRKSKAQKKHQGARHQEYNMANNIDRMAAFREFENNFAPEIRKALLSGKTEKQIMERYKPLIGARLVQIALTGEDSQALGASKEIFDRLDGKSAQKTETTHKFAHLPDQELDALVQTKVAQLEAMSPSDQANDSEDESE